jgi:hypothetical protein
VYVVAPVTANDDTRAQKPNAGDNALNHATRIRDVGVTKCCNRQGRAQSDQSECADPCRLSVQIAVESVEYSEHLHDGTLSSISDGKKADIATRPRNVRWGHWRTFPSAAMSALPPESGH